MRIHAISCAALAVASAFCFSSVSLSQQDDKPKPREKPAAEVVSLAESNNRFGLDLLARLRKDDENIVISPASIAMCLQLLATSADGETETELREMLHVPETDLPAGNRAMLDHWKDREGVTLNIANAVWINPKRMTPAAEFTQKARENFDAEVTALDFGGEGALETINSWISEHTGNKIEKMLEKLGATDPCLLANAIYFKGEWQARFDSADSKQESFQTSTAQRDDVWMMHSAKHRWKYLGGKDVEVLRLPFRDSEFASMWIILPAEGTDLDQFARQMDYLSLEDLFNKSPTRKGEVVLPRFNVRSKLKLNAPLQALGMQQAFGPEADFSKLGENGGKGFFVQDVLHEAVVEVNEEGAEAAAATVVRMGCTGPAPPADFKMICDRPFFFVIRDDQSGALLFMGLIQDPQQ